MILPLFESGLDGYETAYNQQQHVNFIGSDFHVHELFYDGTWHLNDLTQLSGAPPADLGSSVYAYITAFNQQQHVNFVAYVGSEAHLIELYYTTQWNYNDLTELAGAPPVFGTPIHGYVTTFNQQQHINFIGSNFHVYELYYDGAWHHNDLTQLTGAPNAGSTNPKVEDSTWTSILTGYQTESDSQQHVNFIGADYHVHELYYDGAWHHNDLTELASAPNVYGNALAAYETAFNSQQHVNFPFNASGSVHVAELFFDDAWHFNDLSQLTGAPEVVPPLLDGYVTTFNNQMHVNFVAYVGADIHVFELIYNGTTWISNDLTQLTGAPSFLNSELNRGLDGYQTEFNFQQHVNFIDTNQHVHELYYDGAWHHNDLTAIAT